MHFSSTRVLTFSGFCSENERNVKAMKSYIVHTLQCTYNKNYTTFPFFSFLFFLVVTACIAEFGGAMEIESFYSSDAHEFI